MHIKSKSRLRSNEYVSENNTFFAAYDCIKKVCFEKQNIRKRAPNIIVLAPVIMKKTPNKVRTEYNEESTEYNKNSTEYNVKST